MLTSKTFSRTVFLGLACSLGLAASASATQVAGGVGVTQAPVPAAILQPTTPLPAATIDKTTGLASAPAGAPIAVQQAIWAGNKLIGKPYRYGGGHRRFNDTAYDCSGSVSYTLHGGALVTSPLDSTSFEKWGDAGPGEWITVYANGGHAFMTIAGIRMDTSAAGDPGGLSGPRWRVVLRSTKGFVARHPDGL
jgi:hypothetical protein